MDTLKYPGYGRPRKRLAYEQRNYDITFGTVKKIKLVRGDSTQDTGNDTGPALGDAPVKQAS